MRVNPRALRQTRVQEGLSVATVADRASLTTGYIYGLEGGHKRYCSPAAYRRLLVALGKDPSNPTQWRALSLDEDVAS